MLTERSLVVGDRTVEAVCKLGDTIDGPGVDEDGRDDDSHQKHFHVPVERLRELVRAVAALVEGPVPRAAPGVLSHQETEEAHRN